MAYGSQYDAAQNFGQGAQAVNGGVWVPNNDGTMGYTFQQGGVQSGGGGGGGYDPTTAGGGMYGSMYGAYGPSSDPAPATGGTGLVTSAGQRPPIYGLSGSSIPAGYGGTSQDGAYNAMMYPNGAPSPTYQIGMGGQAIPYAGASTAQYNARSSGGSQPGGTQTGIYPAIQTGNPTQTPYVGPPVSSVSSTPQDMSSLTSLLSQFGLGSGNSNSQPGLPGYVPPQASTADPGLMAMLAQIFGSGSAAASTPPAPSTPYAGTGQMVGGGRMEASTPQNYVGPPVSGGSGSTPSYVGPPVAGGGNNQYATGVNGQGQNVYVNSQGQTVGTVPQSTGGGSGTLQFPLPGGSGSGGSLGIPLPQTTQISPPPVPIGPPAQVPTPPWNQSGGGTPTSTPQPQPQTPLTQGQQAILNSGVFGSSVGVPADMQSQWQQALAANPTMAQQYGGTSAAAASTPQGSTGTPAFNFGGSGTSGTTANGTSASGSNTGTTSLSASLQSLLGGLPQPPNLNMTAPTVDAQGNFANSPGGSAIRMSTNPLISDQQQQQLINQATGNNARQAATSAEQSREAMAGRGFSTNSGALGDQQNVIDANRMNADTQAYSQIPLNVAQLNNQAALAANAQNLQGQQNSISSFNSLADFLKNNASLGAQQYGLGIQGYSAYQNALNNLLQNSLGQQGLGIQQYGQDLNAYNAQQNANNSQLQNWLAANQLALQGNNSNQQNWQGLLGVLNQSQGNQNQLLGTLLGTLTGMA